MTKPEHDRWYKTSRWQKLRRRQLSAEPLCRMCKDDGRITAAAICDHVEPHRGDEAKFWVGPFQSLCAEHHNRTKQSTEKGGEGRPPKPTIGVDGCPTGGW
jgi:5-methylcytosine-specific restriction protein A